MIIKFVIKTNILFRITNSLGEVKKGLNKDVALELDLK